MERTPFQRQADWPNCQDPEPEFQLPQLGVQQRVVSSGPAPVNPY